MLSVPTLQTLVLTLYRIARLPRVLTPKFFLISFLSAVSRRSFHSQLKNPVHILEKWQTCFV